MADMEQKHNAGEIGTDEYKALVSLFDRWGRTTPQAFIDMYSKLEAYLTPDSKGVENFANNLVDLGFGTNNNGYYKFDLTHMQDIVDAIGLSEEAIEILFGRLEDFGFNVVYAKDQL